MNTATRDNPTLRLTMRAVWLAGLGLAIGIAGATGTASASTGQTAVARVTATAVRPEWPALAPRHYVIEGGDFTAPNDSQTTGFANCPTGTVVLGGGVYQGSTSLAVTVNSSYPAGDTGWAALVNNTSGVAVSFEVQAICAKAPRDYTIVESDNFDNPAGQQTGGIYAACPAGTKILGGGNFMSSGLTPVAVNTSMPEKRFLYPPTYWWVVTANNGSTSDNLVNAFAVCGKEPGYSLPQGSNVTNPPGTQAFASVTCPATTTIIGGGVYSSSTSTADNIKSSYATVGSWNAYENNGSASDALIFPVAICAT